jgi:hypothetical protein
MKNLGVSLVFVLLSTCLWAQEIELIEAASPIYNFDMNLDLPFDLETTEKAPLKYYALIISVQNYEDKGIKDLDYPVEDGEKIRKMLQDYYTFDPSYTTHLKNPTLKQITDALSELATKVGLKDNLLIFYAGHGYWDEDAKQGYWLPTDAKKGTANTWLSNKDLRDYIQKIKARHTLLLADACFSGSIFKTRSAFFNAPEAIQKLYDSPSRKAITSGALSEVPDKSVFLEFVIKRLGQYPGKFLTAEKLFISMKEEVIAKSKSGQLPQYGEIDVTGNAGGDFIFVRKK